jgi:Ca2+:H+ antiporter
MSSNHNSASTAGLIKVLVVPLFAWLMFFVKHYTDNNIVTLLCIAAMLFVVMSAVHHAETIAHKIGEPLGTLVLALAVTIIEVSIIISMMRNDAEGSEVLARDTVFAAVMIILTGMTGLTLFISGIKFNEAEFGSQGVVSILTLLVAISVLTLILPNYTLATPGPYYSPPQIIFVAVVTLVLYGGFLFVQNFKHRSHYVSKEELEEVIEKPSKRETIISAVLLPVCLVAVVLLAESMAPDLEDFINDIGAPHALAGIIIACVVLLPEGISAVKAAQKNHMQRSLNLSLGSALASISLTIPVVAIYATITKSELALGIGTESTVMFLLSLFVIVLSLSKGKTTILQGLVLLLLFAVYLFITINP